MTQSEPPQGQPPGPQQGDIWGGAGPSPQGGQGAGSPDAGGQPSAPPGPRPPAWTQTLTSTAPSPGPAGFFYADVPNRVIAYIIDFILLFVIDIVLLIIVGALFGDVVTTATLDSAGGDVNVGPFVVLSILQLIVSFAYWGYFWTSWRGTPGMKILGLQIGDEVDGRSITWNQALIRWLVIGLPSILATFVGYLSAGLGGVLLLIAIVWLLILLYTIAQSPTKQGLHDRYAHTIMVKAGRQAA